MPSNKPSKTVTKKKKKKKKKKPIDGKHGIKNLLTVSVTKNLVVCKYVVFKDGKSFGLNLAGVFMIL
jgi:hypothetical protein